MKILDVPQSGSLGGITSSHNRAGQYRRNRRTPVVPTRSDRQGVLRTQFSAASRAWSGLSDAQRAAWTSFAAGYPVTDSLGQSVVLTGNQYFNGVSTQLLNCGQPISNVPPTDTTVLPVTIQGMWCQAGDTPILWVASASLDDLITFGFSRVMSAGRSFNKTFTQFYGGPPEGGAFDAGAQFVSQWGSPVAGQRIFGRVINANIGGMSSNNVIVNCIVSEPTALPVPVTVSPDTGEYSVGWPGDDEFQVLVFISTDGGQTWLAHDILPTQASPATGGAPGGALVRARLFNGSVFSLPSAAVVIEL